MESISYDDFIHLVPMEMADFLGNGKDIPKEKIWLRKKGCAVVVENGKAAILEGGELEEYEAKEGITAKKIEMPADEIKGVTANKCREKGIKKIVYASHERLGSAKRKARMQEILDKGIAMLAEENPDAQILGIGGHTHEQEKPRKYAVKTKDGKEAAAVVYSVGLGNGNIYYQVFNSETGEIEEVEVELKEEDAKNLEALVEEEAKKIEGEAEKAEQTAEQTTETANS